MKAPKAPPARHQNGWRMVAARAIFQHVEADIDLPARTRPSSFCVDRDGALNVVWLVGGGPWNGPVRVSIHAFFHPAPACVSNQFPWTSSVPYGLFSAGSAVLVIVPRRIIESRSQQKMKRSGLAQRFTAEC